MKNSDSNTTREWMCASIPMDEDMSWPLFGVLSLTITFQVSFDNLTIFISLAPESKHMLLMNSIK